MTVRIRVIPCLDVANGRVVKGVNFVDLIDAGDPVEAARASLGRLAAAVAADPTRVRMASTATVRWQPPVIRPGKVLGVAMNNSASDARKISAPNHPMFFLKATTSLLGHGEPLVIRPYYGSLHPEPELGVIIGCRARDLDPHTALDAVYGYTIINDVTWRDIQRRHGGQWHEVHPEASVDQALLSPQPDHQRVHGHVGPHGVLLRRLHHLLERALPRGAGARRRGRGSSTPARVGN